MSATYRSIGDEVMNHVAKDTYSTGDGIDFLELTHEDAHNSAGNLYLAALGIIRKQKSANAALVEALEEISRVLTMEEHLHPDYGWGDFIQKHITPVLNKAKG